MFAQALSRDRVPKAFDHLSDLGRASRSSFGQEFQCVAFSTSFISVLKFAVLSHMEMLP